MRVGLQLAGTISPRSGGEYTFVRDLLTALSKRQTTASHEFVVCYRDGAKALVSKFPGFEAVNIDLECPPTGGESSSPWEDRITGLLHKHGIQFNVLMQHWAETSYDVPYATHLWDVQHRNNPWFPEVSHGGAWEKREALISRILQRASFVITASETSRNEISRYYQLQADRIRILPFPTPTFALDKQLLSQAPQERRISNDFILYPAQFWAHKNHVLLLEACKQLREQWDWDLELAFVGSDKGNKKYLRRYAAEIGIKAAVHYLGYVSQAELIRLYRQAFCLAFPTFCGPDNLPPLEAFGLGCPVLASDIPGAREQCGDAALFFEPKSVSDLVEKLINLRDQGIRNKLIAAGHARAKVYTWDNYVDDLNTVINDFSLIRRCWDSGAGKVSDLVPLSAEPFSVGFDLRHITREASGGITPLLTETVKSLQKLCPHWRLHVFGTIFNRDIIDIIGPSVTHHSLPLHGYYPCMDSILAAEQVKVLFRSFPNNDDLNFPLRKQICLIPDLQHEFFPEFFSYEVKQNRQNNFSRLIRECGAVATISKHAKNSIQQRFRDCSADVFVMSPSSQLSFDHDADYIHDAETPTALSENILALRPYFYFPANLWPHKNHDNLLRAFALFRDDKRFSSHNLVFTGHTDPKRWKELTRTHSMQNVHHLGFVSKPDLVFLYRHAQALTFLSRFEGFGMPVLEAFGAGCPVICSNSTSLPEVADGAAILCDPLNPTEIAAAMRRVVLEPGLAQELVEKGRQRLAAYSWSAAAENLKQAFIRVSSRGIPVSSRRDNAAVPDAKPLVSIVTPSFNQGRFLRRTIESVLNQSYSKLEYIVIDGGSSDNSVEILKSYGNRLRWVSEPDGGQTNAINKGLAQCSGRILTYLNSDDTLEPNAVEKVVSFFLHHPEIDLVYGNANYIDTGDKVTGRYPTAPYSFERLVHDCCICQPAAFWRSSVLHRIGLFDESLNYTMDYDFWLRIAKHGFGIEFIPDTLANSRLYPENKTLSARKNIYKEIFAISMRHAGRVSNNYIQGYWHHRLRERNDILAKLGRTVPKLDKVLIEYDAFRYEQSGRTHLEAAWHLSRLIASKLRIRRITWAKQSPMAGSLTTGVTGVFSDNWLAPRVEMSPSPTRSRPLVLSGVAPTDCVVRIEAGQVPITQRRIVGNTPTRMEFAGTDEVITLEFDNFVTDGAGRKLSFRVEHTNCFSEDEI